MFESMTQNPSHELPHRPSRARSGLGQEGTPDVASDYRPLNWNRGFTPPETDEPAAPTNGSGHSGGFGVPGPEPHINASPEPEREDPRLRRPAVPGETAAASVSRREASEVMSARQAIATGLVVLGILAIVAVAVYVLSGIQTG